MSRGRSGGRRACGDARTGPPIRPADGGGRERRVLFGDHALCRSGKRATRPGAERVERADDGAAAFLLANDASVVFHREARRACGAERASARGGARVTSCARRGVNACGGALGRRSATPRSRERKFALVCVSVKVAQAGSEKHALGRGGGGRLGPTTRLKISREAQATNNKLTKSRSSARGAARGKASSRPAGGWQPDTGVFERDEFAPFARARITPSTTDICKRPRRAAMGRYEVSIGSAGRISTTAATRLAAHARRARGSGGRYYVATAATARAGCGS